MTVLKDKMLVRFEFDESGETLISDTNFFEQEWGRLRDICVSPDGKIYLATNGYFWPSQPPNEIIELYNADYIGLNEVNSNDQPFCIGYYSILGEKLSNIPSLGVYIEAYSDGTMIKKVAIK